MRALVCEGFFKALKIMKESQDTIAEIDVKSVERDTVLAERES